MKEKKIKKIFFLAAAALLTGCPEQVGDQCPKGTTSLGQFNLAFTGEHPAGECKAPQLDGAVGPLVLENGGTRSATFCYGTASDGGGQIQLFVPQSSTRTSPLLDGGGFIYPASSSNVVGTACDATDGGTCPV